ncbi:Non-heme haloperoxidase [Xanthomonas campestris pv. raphani 756C]|nr:Non-heme haloperoxidase [Xanthomonas campestris pv. raphani 756C]
MSGKRAAALRTLVLARAGLADAAESALHLRCTALHWRCGPTHRDAACREMQPRQCARRCNLARRAHALLAAASALAACRTPAIVFLAAVATSAVGATGALPHQGVSMHPSEPSPADSGRRNFLVAGTAAVAALSLPAFASAATPARASSTSPPHPTSHGATPMSNFVTRPDGAKIFYKDWGKGQPVVFSHGWPLSADAWDAQMLFMGQNGFRVIAHDRRSHGRSSQTWDGNDMDTYADDLAAVIEALDLKDAILVGHSTGGGEVAHYVGRHGSKRVAKVVLVGAVPPQMVKSPTNPGGLPISVFDGIREGVAKDRSQFYQDLSTPFFGANRDGNKVTQGMRDSFWLQGMLGGHKGQYDCIKEFSEVDYTADLKKIDVPALVVHGDDDQIVPIDASGKLSAKIIKNAELKIYAGAPHGLPVTHADQFNKDLLAFAKA